MLNKLLGKYARVRGNQGLHSYHVHCASSFPIFSVSLSENEKLESENESQTATSYRIETPFGHTCIPHTSPYIHHSPPSCSIFPFHPPSMHHASREVVKCKMVNLRPEIHLNNKMVLPSWVYTDYTLGAHHGQWNHKKISAWIPEFYHLHLIPRAWTWRNLGQGSSWCLPSIFQFCKGERKSWPHIDNKSLKIIGQPLTTKSEKHSTFLDSGNFEREAKAWFPNKMTGEVQIPLKVPTN